MAAEGSVIVTHIFTGEEERDEHGDYIIPQDVTRLLFHESVTVIPAYLFWEHPNIVELICHAGVKRIESYAFYRRPRLRRLIIPGVEVVEQMAFDDCIAVTYVECPNLERIKWGAFRSCESLGNINLSSAKVVGGYAFINCWALTDVKVGKNLESIGGGAFLNCISLERITIPLKNGLIPDDNTFKGCSKLKCVDLVEGAVLRETVDALLLEKRRADMNEEIDSINQILPNARTGDIGEVGDKAIVIREWITRVLRKITHYKAEHRRLFDVAATALQHALPNDIVMNNVLPFLQLPSYKFDGENQEEGEGKEENENNVDNSNDESNIADPGEDDDYEGREEEEEDCSDDEEEAEGVCAMGTKRRKVTNANEERVGDD